MRIYIHLSIHKIISNLKRKIPTLFQSTAKIYMTDKSRPITESRLLIISHTTTSLDRSLPSVTNNNKYVCHSNVKSKGFWLMSLFDISLVIHVTKWPDDLWSSSNWWWLHVHGCDCQWAQCTWTSDVCEYAAVSWFDSFAPARCSNSFICVIFKHFVVSDILKNPVMLPSAKC